MDWETKENRQVTFLNFVSEKRKRVPCQNVLMSFRPGSERHFTSAIDLFKAVNFPWISDAKETNDVLYQAEKLPNMLTGPPRRNNGSNA